MANNQGLVNQQTVIDYATEFGYPATALVFPIYTAAYLFHLIWYGAAPSTNFASAPNGSMLWDFVNGNIYQKRGTIGLTNGTWKAQAINT